MAPVLRGCSTWSEGGPRRRSNNGWLSGHKTGVTEWKSLLWMDFPVSRPPPVFPSARHPASWAGLAPGSNESAGRVKSNRTRPGNRYLKGALGIAAWNLLTNGDFYRDPGADYYTAHRPAVSKARAVNQLQALGYRVTLEPLAQPT